MRCLLGIAKYRAIKMSVPIMLMNMRGRPPARNWMDCINCQGPASSAFVSQTKKAVPATPLIVSAETMAALDQPAALPSDKPHTIAVMATVSSITPGQSIFETRRSLLWIRNVARNAVATQSGTLTQNTQRQPRLSTSKPPMTGPDNTARPVRLLNIPIARGRCSGVTADPSSVIAIGTRMAEAAP
jgi:hypothetical protein